MTDPGGRRAFVEVAAGVVMAAGGLAVTMAAAPAIVANSVSAAPLPAPPGATPPSPRPPSPSSTVGAPHDAPEGRPALAYRWSARLDAEAHEIAGKGDIEWTNTSRRPQSEVYVHLYLNAFRDARSAFMRSDAGAGFRGGGRPSRWGGIDVETFHLDGHDLWPDVVHSPDDPDDATDIRVALPEPVAPGQSVTFEVAFTARLPTVVARVGYAGDFHLVAQWFPKLARLEADGTWRHFKFHRLGEFYADFAAYDVAIDTPRSMTVGATGQLVSRREDGDRKTERFVAAWVHDFAFTAWPGFEVHEAVGPHGVAMRAMVPRGEEALARLELEEASAAMADYERWYGRYPYPTLTIVHPPPAARGSGGMEYPTFITTGGSPLGARWGVRSVRGVTAHELAHQWFYGLLASDEFRHPYLDEGLTTFATARSLAERFGSGSGFEGLGWSVTQWAYLRAASARAWQIGALDRAVDQFPTGGDYGVSVYAKTAVLLETLRRVYGDPAFDGALRRYAERHRYGHPAPDDLVAAFPAPMGKQLAAGVAGGFVDYEVAGVTPLEGREGAPHRTRVVLRRRGDLLFPVVVAIVDADARETRRTWDARGGRTETFVHEGAAPVRTVTIDPERRVLMDRDLTNNHRRVTPLRVATRIQGWVATALALAWTGWAP
ncbi:MAG: M1 family metallopeptidase [Myxococcota bacterium]